MAGAQPGFQLAGAVVARGHHGGQADQHQQQGRAAQRHRQRGGGGALPGPAALGGKPALVPLHLADDRADAVHQLAAAIGAHQRQRRFFPAGPLQRDGLVEFGQLVGRQPPQQVDAVLLAPVVDRQRAQRGQGAGKGGLGARERQQIGLGAGEQEAALAGLGVLQDRDGLLDLLDHLERVGHGIRRLGAFPQRQQREHRHGENSHHGGAEAEQQAQRHQAGQARAAGACGGRGTVGLLIFLLHRCPVLDLPPAGRPSAPTGAVGAKSMSNGEASLQQASAPAPSSSPSSRRPVVRLELAVDVAAPAAFHLERVRGRGWRRRRGCRAGRGGSFGPGPGFRLHRMSSLDAAAPGNRRAGQRPGGTPIARRPSPQAHRRTCPSCKPSSAPSIVRTAACCSPPSSSAWRSAGWWPSRRGSGPGARTASRRRTSPTGRLALGRWRAAARRATMGA